MVTNASLSCLIIGRALQDFYRRDAKIRRNHAKKVCLHASEYAFSHKVDMPSKLVELKIARMQCIAVFANLQTKMGHPGVNKIVVHYCLPTPICSGNVVY